VAVLEALTDEEGTVSADASAKKWRERLDDAFRRAPAVPRGFQGELRDYQIEGFRWMSRLGAAGLGACLADDMGLGKTVQIIALLLHRASQGPALVVAPTSVCEGWCRELERFGPTLRVRRAFGPARGDAMTGWKRRDVVVTSYTLLQQDAVTFQAPEWATAVLDEAQLVKNAETLRAKAAMGLRAEARLVATGTPVENHAGDLHSLFAFLNPGLLGTQKEFLARVDRGGDVWRSVKRQLQPFILRRTKAEVLADLPPVTEIQRDVYFSPGEAKLYDSVRRAALDKLVDGTGRDRIRMLAELTRLRRLCCHPGLVSPEAGLTSAKLESFLELAEELVAAGHRALVFSQFTDVLALVRPLLEAKQISYQYLDGSTPTHQRSAAVDAFQAGEGDLFLISLKAGGFGLNLTGADYVIHLDPWWNPAVESQASDRAHRIGQTRPVTVYRLVNAGTIEERIVELHRDKRDLADAVLADTDKSGKLTAKEMRALLESE
jgi:SNF2 family DNA or RNA helicase